MYSMKYFLTTLFLFFSFPALACSVSLDQKAHTPISYPINETLFNTIFLDYLNAYRCQHNLAPLTSNTFLARESKRHAEWMAENTTVSHNSTMRNRITPTDRINQTHLRYTTGAENVARIAHYRVDAVPGFQQRGTCQFYHQGRLLEKRTYAQAAAFMSANYIKSEGHRRNIMNPQFTITGMAITLDPNDAWCGQLYHAQLFTD